MAAREFRGVLHNLCDSNVASHDQDGDSGEWQDPWYPGTPIDLAAARDRRVARDSARAARGGALRPWARPGILVAAAAAVIAVALTGVLLLRDTSTPQRRFDVALSTTELAPGAAVTPA